MGLLDKIKAFLKPLPEQQVMDRLEDMDPNENPNDTLRDLGSTHPHQSIDDDVRPPGE